MAPSLIAFEAWAQANAAATAAEKKIHQAAVDFAYGRGGPPTDADLQDAFAKRMLATQAFEEVLREQARLAAQFSGVKSASGGSAENSGSSATAE